MFLKSLELNGFKSFASKAVLEFPKGITAIVGPNGSGKSNIIDAIRWILGEREAKNLRGDKIENLIFAGTPKRPRVAMAQVGLNFENNKEISGADFSEISVVRRASRDGISQYFLNKSEIRLRDVVDFFARARLGTKGLTIINQGNSDLFVRANSFERKAMIEEVLGLREYQLKKSEAERKLNNTANNLDKTRAMIEEVIPRLRMLKRQTLKWEKRAQVESELKELENGYFSFKLAEIEKEKQNIEPNLRELEKQISGRFGELKILEDEVRKLESKSEGGELNDIKNKKSELLNRHLKIQKELSRLEARVEILGEAEEKQSEIVFKNDELIDLIKGIKKSLNEIELNNLEEVLSAVKKVIGRIDNFLTGPKSEQSDTSYSYKAKEIEDLGKIKNDLLKEIELIEEDVKKIEKIEMEITAGMQEFNKQFQKAYEAMEDKRREINNLENQKQRMIFEKEKIEMKLADLENQIQQAGRQISEFNSSTLQVNNIDIYEIERKILRLRGELASMGEVDHTLIKECEETEKHYNFLSSQTGDLEKASEDLKILIRELKDKIHNEFLSAFNLINEHFNKYFHLMFGGGSAKLKIKKYEAKIANSEEGDENKNEDEDGKKQDEQEEKIGVEIDLNLPRKKITSLEMLSGGEKSLVSIAALFALISVSPPPFLVVDEIDAPLDEKNSKRFADLVKEFAHQTQFIIVTHNRAVMEVADVLYGVTMDDDGTSKLLSLKLENAS